MNNAANTLKISLNGESVRLLPQKALYWEERQALLLADLHIGKTGHFRKHGIPVPDTVNNTNLEMLDKLLDRLEPTRLIILGDLFHSSKNRQWKQFEQWRNKYSGLEIFLVVGNHDILPSQIYHSSKIHLFRKLSLGPFLLLHDHEKESDPDKTASGSNEKYLLSGHIHPAIQLKGKGRQSMKLPCFCFGKKSGILPAFGQFTGTHVIEPQPGDRIFAVAENRILSLETKG